MRERQTRADHYIEQLAKKPKKRRSEGSGGNQRRTAQPPASQEQPKKEGVIGKALRERHRPGRTKKQEKQKGPGFIGKALRERRPPRQPKPQKKQPASQQTVTREQKRAPAPKKPKGPGLINRALRERRRPKTNQEPGVVKQISANAKDALKAHFVEAGNNIMPNIIADLSTPLTDRRQTRRQKNQPDSVPSPSTSDARPSRPSQPRISVVYPRPDVQPVEPSRRLSQSDPSALPWPPEYEPEVDSQPDDYENSDKKSRNRGGLASLAGTVLGGPVIGAIKTVKAIGGAAKELNYKRKSRRVQKLDQDPADDPANNIIEGEYTLGDVDYWE